MKRLVLITTTVLLAISARAASMLYDVRCPQCLTKQILKATTVGSNGGYAVTTNINGVEVTGSIQTQSGTFHCRQCHFDFTAQIKPDKFVPNYPATAVEVTGSPSEAELAALTAPPSRPAPPVAPSPTDSKSGITLADGSQLVISPAALQGEQPAVTLVLDDGSSLFIYRHSKK